MGKLITEMNRDELAILVVELQKELEALYLILRVFLKKDEGDS